MRLDEGKVWVQETASTTLASNTEKGITKDDWDQWTEARDRQALLTGKDESVHPTGPAYGWSDLNTYGEWVTLPGNRFGWSPYAPAGWSPYTYGMWNSYGGMGWTWISADPWGWVTDHCGMWDFDTDLRLVLDEPDVWLRPLVPFACQLVRRAGMVRLGADSTWPSPGFLPGVLIFPEWVLSQAIVRC